MITRKHYKAIAEIIKYEYTLYNNTDNAKIKLAIKYITLSLATYFALDNSQFNRQKFLDACGLWV